MTYYVYVTLPDGVVTSIEEAIEDLCWEENEKELSARISFTAYNGLMGKTSRISDYIKIGTPVAIFADWGRGIKPLVSGKIKECERSFAGNEYSYKVTAYDALFELQKSQENVYFADGKTTRAALEEILQPWGIHIRKYTGPDVAHSKLVYKNKSLSDIVIDILDDAAKRGGCKALMRAEADTLASMIAAGQKADDGAKKISVLKLGSNKNVYIFTKENSMESKLKTSVVNMVTRVKVISNGKGDTAPSVEATVDGDTSYGIIQRIQTHNSSDTLEDAKKAAREILDEKGSPEKTYTVTAPDVPPIRKGDRIRLDAGSWGYFTVKSVQHNCSSDKMTMQLERYREKDDDLTSSKQEFAVGETVYFNGGMYYGSPAQGSKGHNALPSRAKIVKYSAGYAYPYKLISRKQKDSPVNGWVPEGSFKRI